MRLGIFIVVLLTANLRSFCKAAEPPQDSNVGADYQENISGFIFAYTLMTVNSPDCGPSLVDNFPVRVQYRTIRDSDTSVSKWMDSPGT